MHLLGANELNAAGNMLYIFSCDWYYVMTVYIFSCDLYYVMTLMA